MNCDLSNLGCWSKRNLFTLSKKSPQSCTLAGGSPLTFVVVFDIVQSGEYVIGGGIQDNSSSKLRAGNEYVLILRGQMTKKLHIVPDTYVAILRCHGYALQPVSQGSISKSFLFQGVRY
jgi:hypothetical protein